MKKITLVLYIIALIFESCYSYYTESNSNGISQFKNKKLILKRNINSYASDGILVKNVDLIFFNDTISKRCFTSIELEQLKKIFLKDTLLAKEPFSISAYSEIDLENCLGLFYVRFPNVREEDFFINVSLLKLRDTIIVSGLHGCSDIGIQMEEYIKQNLSTKYDTIEISKRIEIFNKGKLKERINRGQLLR